MIVTDKLVRRDVVSGVLEGEVLHRALNGVLVGLDANPLALAVDDVRHLAGQGVVHEAVAAWG